MIELEELKVEMKNEYEKYKVLYNLLSRKKDTIDGCLNRIAISDDMYEVQRLYNLLISQFIKEYKDIARKCHKQWLFYSDLFDEYLKVKNK